MKYEELPEIPKIWIDFLDAKLPLLPGPLELHRISDVTESVRKACIPNCNLPIGAGSVAIVANVCASLFGGPVSQILKCLTAIKVCEELKTQGIAAVPVCWIHSESPCGSSRYVLQLLDHNFEIHRFALDEALPLSQMAEMLAKIGQIGAGSFDETTFELLKDSFGADETLSSANARWIVSLMQEWGMIVLDSESPPIQKAWNEAHSAVFYQKMHIQSLMQSVVLPVAVYIADPQEIYGFAKAAPAYEALHMAQPLIWPRCGATIMNSRSRRTLERYHLNFSQLFGGETNVMEFVKNSMANQAPEILQKLKSETEASLMEAGLMESQDKKFSKIRDRCREKIHYQLEKLHRHAVGAVRIKEQTAMRKIHRACNLLAPNGHLQETELAGIQIPLRYGRAGLQALYDKLDIRNLEHQIIELE
jgi:uncharacterized protein YllA (UPF0747 family)